MAHASSTLRESMCQHSEHGYRTSAGSWRKLYQRLSRTQARALGWKLKRIAAAAGALALLSAPVSAMTIAGVRLAPAFESDVGELRLLACTVRNTLWINHYVAALYGPREAPAALLRDPGTPKALRMHIIEDRFLPKDLPEAWHEPLKRNLQAPDFHQVRNVFSRVAAGDVITILYLPGTGAILAVNGQTRLTVRAQAHAVVDTLLERWGEDEPMAAKIDRLTSRNAC
jgi:hypothetical protein